MADLATLAARFGLSLRRAGLLTTPEQACRFAQAVLLVSPSTVDDLYWAGRVTLVSKHTEIDAFDRVFAQVFRGFADPADLRGDLASPPPVSVRPGEAPRRRGRVQTAGHGSSPLPGSGGSQPSVDGNDLPVQMEVGAASRDERLATTDFSELDDFELAELRRMMRGLRLAAPMRRGRRQQRHRRGERLDLRATVRRSHRSGGDPLVRVRRRRRHRPRRLVVLCDVSGSMAPYARAYLQFLHAAAGASRAEVFTFATRLTRVTKALAVPDPVAALAAAATAVPDWRGGTRIGEAVKSFLDSYGRRGLARGAVVVIASDGWECDSPVLLGEQMSRLRRLAYRVVWINPRSADPRYRPLTGGMAAALPFCDAMVSGHNAAALDEVVDAISGVRSRTAS